MTYESLLAFSPPRFEGRWKTQAYTEEAFRHFLALERRRAEQSSRSSLLVLVSLKRSLGASARFSPQVARKLFSGLAGSLRDVDFIGWYREGRVAAAVLAQGTVPSVQTSHRVVVRVTQVLCSRLPSEISERVQVRIKRVGRKTIRN